MNKEQEILQALNGLLSIPSVTASGPAETPFGAETHRALDYTLDLCASLGFRTKNCANKVGWAEVGEGDEMVAILVHLDVVPAGEGWDYPPFALTEADGKLFGRGIADDKGPAIVCIYAMKALMDSGIPLKRRIRIIFGMAEEGGDWSDMEYYCQNEEAPVCGFTPDGSFPAAYGEKGFATYQMFVPLAGSGLELLEGGQAENVVADVCRAVVKGQPLEAQGSPAHGSLPWLGDNAISHMMADLAGLPVADLYNACIGFDLYGERLGCQTDDGKVGPLTVNVGKVRTIGENIVFWLDIRYPTSITAEEILDRLNATVEPLGARVVTEYYQKPVYLGADSPLITGLMDAYRQVTGDAEAEAIRLTGGTYAKAMENIAVFGPILPDRESTLHQKNEYLLKEDFFLILDIYREALKRLAT